MLVERDVIPGGECERNGRDTRRGAGAVRVGVWSGGQRFGFAVHHIDSAVQLGHHLLFVFYVHLHQHPLPP